MLCFVKQLETVKMNSFLRATAFITLIAGAGCHTDKQMAKPSGFELLFPNDGVPTGWTTRHWAEVRDPVKEETNPWKVEGGVLNGNDSIGSWLLSEKEYSDFIVDFDWKLGARGNSGTALRAPLYGDPAFDGMELQMVDPRYYPASMKVPTSELTASLYKAVAPMVQAYKPTEWNHYHITCIGPKVQVELNGQKVLDVNLDEQTTPTKRHNGTAAPPLRDRPRTGHIGFQELSKDEGHVEIRNAQIKVLK